MNQNKPHAYWGILFLLLLAVLAGFIILVLPTALQNKKADIIKTIAYLKSEFPFADLKINGKNGQNIIFTLTMVNIDGDKILTKDFNLKGNDIYLESKVVVVKAEDQEKAFIFPAKLYSDEIPEENGSDLFSLYVENNYPKNYLSTNRDPGFISTIKNIFQISLTSDENTKNLEAESIKIILNMDAVLHQAAFNNFQEGKSYRCILHSNGGLELLEVK